jgi:hypothetical protein
MKNSEAIFIPKKNTPAQPAEIRSFSGGWRVPAAGSGKEDPGIFYAPEGTGLADSYYLSKGYLDGSD